MRIPNMCLVLKLDNGKVVSIANEQTESCQHVRRVFKSGQHEVVFGVILGPKNTIMCKHSII